MRTRHPGVRRSRPGPGDRVRGPRGLRAPRDPVQLACRIDRALHARVRAQAARAGQTLRTVVIGALERALAGRVTRARSSPQ